MMPPRYFAILLLVTLGGVFSPFRYVKPPYTYLGIGPIVLGVILNLWTDSIFKKRKTTVKPDEKPTYFEESGPFAISRHPMYLGMVLILFGAAIMTGCMMVSMTSLIFAWIMETRFIPLEEANMKKAFGKRYLEYKKRVRRWI